MKTLTVELKQHTPLIHFQHSQQGATLRASEVKPKLDRFILTKLGNGNYQKGIDAAKNNGWLVGKGEHPALDYKMRIEASENKEEYLIASYLSSQKITDLTRNGINVLAPTPYFAQEKENGTIAKIPNGQDQKNAWNRIRCKGLKHNWTKVYIRSFSDTLIEEIAGHIQEFFIANNFGTRQDKGFGSYTVLKGEIKETCYNVEGAPRTIELKRNEELLEKAYSIRYRKRLNRNVPINKIFSTITRDYRLLKSGINDPYAKSKLMLYGRRFKQRWEKKFIKDCFYEYYSNSDGEAYKLKSNAGRNFSHGIAVSEDYCYLRALLGLAGQYEFILENPPFGNDRNKAIITVDGGEVERFKSPIFFKVIDNTIYMLANEIPREILNKEFYFVVSIDNDTDPDNQNDRIEDSINTPANFNLAEFLEFAMNDSDDVEDNDTQLHYEVF